MEEIKYPTQVIELPSKGLVYPMDNPLSSGKIELKYPTAREEDILTNKNYITKDIAIDKFIESIIVDKNINPNDLIVGDNNKIVFAARILAYGKDYESELTCKKCGNTETLKFDLNEFEDENIDTSILNRDNEYELELPVSKVNVTFKLLTVGDEKTISAINKKMNKKFKNSKNSTTELQHTIIAVNEDRDKTKINKFIDMMSTKDILALRKKIKEISPNINTHIEYECENCNYEGEIRLPLDLGFFWPSTKL
jgi:hypothetical protein